MKVILALGDAEWEAEFISTISHPMLNLQLVRRCVDGLDLLAAASVHEVDVVVVGDATLRLGANEISQLVAASVLVVAISNSPQRWQDLGAQFVIDLDTNDLFRVAHRLSKVISQVDVTENALIATCHELVCVASFGGGVGRSLVAKELGWWNAKAGNKTVVVEGDTYGPSLIQELNLPATSRDLLQLSQLRMEVDGSEYALNEFAVVEPNLVVVPGLSHSANWPALRRAQLERMWQNLKMSGDTVVDLGPVFSSPGSTELESGFMHRDVVAETAISHAKSVAFCAKANTVSVTRLIQGFLDHETALRNLEVCVILNRSRNSKVATELMHLVTRHTGIEQVISVPEDLQLIEHAELKCEFVGKLAPRNEISVQLRELATQLFAKANKPSSELQVQRLQRATAA